ncbi:MAG: FlgD immunoglobulin-like domain containing protein [Candidatus Eisenbacteria bacterium]
MARGDRARRAEARSTFRTARRGHAMCARAAGVALVLAHCVSASAASVDTPSAVRVRPVPVQRGAAGVRSSREAGVDTLWIFDADFSDLVGDNAGWTSVDRSGTLGYLNHWHKDTLRPCPRPEGDPGDSSWWCGTYDPRCFKQPRGYGNQWSQVLEHDFPLSSWSASGDTVTLEFDQRYAMERFYDYGYVDVSDDGGQSWTTLSTFTNVGYMGAGLPVDWDHWNGHQALDASAFAGQDVRLQFRFESDDAYSPQDTEDNPPQHSVLDGAWQLDNIEWLVNGSPVWSDDCESPGDNGWVHDGKSASGQTGVTFRRGQFGVDFFTGREGPDCFAPPVGTWMMAAVDSVTGAMVDEQHSWLVSPPIDVEGATNLVARWTMWIDLPQNSNDVFNLSLRRFDPDDCPEFVDDGFTTEVLGSWYGGPFWGTWSDNWSAFTGRDSLRFRWEEFNADPPTDPHMGGIFLVRQRLGVLTGSDPATYFARDTWNWFNDWFVHDLAEALEDTARLRVRDEDGVASVTLLASNTGGAPFEAYTCIAEVPSEPEWFKVPPPASQMTPGSEILYFFETLDGLGNASVYPADAPDNTFEMSMLPIVGSVGEPGLLLVDKHGSTAPGEDRGHGHASEYFYREALEVLGYEFDVYDVEVAGGTIKSDGPDTAGMKYYDTQVWFAGDEDSYVMLRSDQLHLIQWLGQASSGKERNLLLSGSNICWELQSPESSRETLGFLSDWMGAEYLFSGLDDTLPGLQDAAGGSDFMTYDDGACVLAEGCPDLLDDDVVAPVATVHGAAVAVEYVTASRDALPAGVAHTNTVTGYQSVVLGFGIERMMDELLPNGHFTSGIADRSNLLGNVLDYFGKTPTGPGTSVPETVTFVNRIERAHPNPFNPRTTLRYSVASPGRVRVRVYDLAGRVVRTLVDEDVEPGEYGLSWDGTTNAGERAASGVYFVRMETDGFRASTKTVLLK